MHCYLLTQKKGNYNALFCRFSKFIEDKKDLTHEQYFFNNRNQKEGETFQSFLTDKL